jgi:L,D-peptidoglycan transpeptidase YkuD (ErfK/YbiS/YcfS/YnhG family)
MTSLLRVDVSSATLVAFDQAYRVALGKGGVVAEAAKREGDGATPIGRYSLDGLLLRPDRMPTPVTKLPWRWLRPDDGWADDPADPAYNRPVVHPHPRSAERLWRADHAYDLILVLGHNQRPVVPGLGSAIFWHVAQPDWRPTEGCVAMDRDSLWSLLPRLSPGLLLDIG